MISAAQGLFDNSDAELHAYELAIRWADEAAKSGDTDMLRLQAQAIFGKSLTHDFLGQTALETEGYKQMIERFAESADPQISSLVSVSLLNYGIALQERGDVVLALELLDQLVTRLQTRNDADALDTYGNAQIARGACFDALGDTEREISAYDQIISRFEATPSDALREYCGIAFLNRGIAFQDICGDPQEASGCYAKAVELLENRRERRYREMVAEALLRRAQTLNALNRSEEKLKVLETVEARFSDMKYLELKVATATHEKANFLRELGRLSEAAHQYRELATRYLGAGGELGEIGRDAAACGAEAYVRQSDFVEAAGLLEPLVDRPLAPSDEPARDRLERALELLVTCYQRLGRASDEKRARQKLADLTKPRRSK
jgi:tetratricopeptide (TPR) repeat protein